MSKNINHATATATAAATARETRRTLGNAFTPESGGAYTTVLPDIRVAMTLAHNGSDVWANTGQDRQSST